MWNSRTDIFRKKTFELRLLFEDFEANVRKFFSQDTQDRLQQEEDARNQLFQQKKKLEQENSGLKKDVEDLELAIQKVSY